MTGALPVLRWGSDHPPRPASTVEHQPDRVRPAWHRGTDGTLVSLPSGHFAAREQPELFSTEIRTAFRSLR